MRMRVEDLAARADVSVDTVRFYQKQRLLPPPEKDGRVAWYTEEHVERMERIRELQRRGFSLAVIRRFLAGELQPADEELAAAVASAGDDGLTQEEFFDVDELGARAGIPAPVLESLLQEGFLVPRVHEGKPCYTEADVEVVTAGIRLVEAGLPLPELFALARHHHAVTREVAAQAVELFDTHVRKPLRSADLDEAERAERLVAAFRTLLPAVTTVVGHHFRRVLLQVAQEHLEAVGDPIELAAAQAENDRPEPFGASSGAGVISQVDPAVKARAGGS